MMRTVVLGLMCAALLLWNFQAQAETSWPQKSIQVIVPWNPGGGSDLSARIVMDKVAAILGQPVVITNISGAAGLNGALRVNSARPDGYTMLWEHPANLAIAPAIGKAKFTWKDFEMAGSIGTSDIAVIVKGDAKWNNMKEIIDDIKTRPGQIKWSLGVNSASHFTFLAISDSVGGLKIMQIPGAGDKARIINVMGGVCDITTAGYAAVAPYAQSGDVKILAMASPERSALAPQYPTLKEQGINAESVFLYSAEFPKGTPQDVVSKFQAAIRQAVEDPGVIELLKKQGIAAEYRDAATTSAVWARESDLYHRLAKENRMIR